MGLEAILALSFCAALLGWLAPRRWLAPLALLVSIPAIYWLQPSSSIRNLDFWLPTASIALVVIVWAIVGRNDVPTQTGGRNSIPTYLLLAFVPVLLIALTRYAGPACCLTPSRPPAILPVLLTLALLTAAVGFIRRIPVHKDLLATLGIALLLVVFILLKTPPLAARMSALLRLSAGQSSEFASPTDLAWLGYSFLAFRLIHALRDAQSGKLPPLSFPRFAAYALFFPTFVAGPIDRVQRWNEELDCLENSRRAVPVEALRLPVKSTGAQRAHTVEDQPPRSQQWADTLAGAQRILVGVFKKFALADSLALFALNAQNAAQTASPGWMWVLLFGYTLRIYLDFSGYTDVAIGLGRLMGFHLPENFASPYLKTNLTAFWNSWHITLTQWIRSYYFNPLLRFMRTRSRSLSTGWLIFVGQVSTMILIGLWHGITWNFLFWGVWHGLGLFFHNRWSGWLGPRLADMDKNFFSTRLLPAAGWALTFLFVSLGWIWFALPTPLLSLSVFKTLFGF